MKRATLTMLLFILGVNVTGGYMKPVVLRMPPMARKPESTYNTRIIGYTIIDGVEYNIKEKETKFYYLSEKRNGTR